MARVSSTLAVQICMQHVRHAQNHLDRTRSQRACRRNHRFGLTELGSQTRHNARCGLRKMLKETRTPQRSPESNCVIFPVTVLVDSRENRPYEFTELRGDFREGNRPIVVRTKVITMTSGDYSLDGYTDRISVERKTLSDLFSTLSRRRRCFENELDRLNDLEFAAIVIESTWEQILSNPPERSRLTPKSVYRSVIAWQQRFSRVHWWTCFNRRFAEVTTFRILQRFYRDHKSEERVGSGTFS